MTGLVWDIVAPPSHLSRRSFLLSGVSTISLVSMISLLGASAAANEGWLLKESDI